MYAVDATPDRAKAALATAGERLGRLKLNGSVVRRSPLSDVVELKMLRLGTQGKAAAWRTLRAVAAQDEAAQRGPAGRVHARAEEQAALLETLREQAVTGALLR